MCEIATNSSTPSNTIVRSLESVENNFKVNRNCLPYHLSLDDFKSDKRFSSSGMSMCLINATNHRIIDIPEMRRTFKTIKKHKSEIGNSFVLPRLTNAPIEVVNNCIKVVKCITYV